MKPSFAMLDMGDDSNEVKIVLWASRNVIETQVMMHATSIIIMYVLVLEIDHEACAPQVCSADFNDTVNKFDEIANVFVS